jgi:hypothetical protein
MTTDDSTLKAARKILWESWDPIGVNRRANLSDEYDSYAPGLVRLLAAGCSARELEAHLARLETESMGLSGRPASVRASTVAALLALRDS